MTENEPQSDCSKKDVLQRVKEIIDNLPDADMNPASRQLLREDPVEWVASRKRAMRAAILNLDEAQMKIIEDDMAHVVGIREAHWWMLEIMYIMYKDIQLDEDLTKQED